MAYKTFEERHGFTREALRLAVGAAQAQKAKERLIIEQGLCRSIGLRGPSIQDPRPGGKGPRKQQLKTQYGLCSGCGCPYNEKTYACKTCNNRYSYRRRRAEQARR